MPLSSKLALCCISLVVLALFLAALTGPSAPTQTARSACNGGICVFQGGDKESSSKTAGSHADYGAIGAFDVSIVHERVSVEGDDLGIMAYAFRDSGRQLHAPLEPPVISVRAGNVLELRIRNDLAPNKAPPPAVEALLDADARDGSADEASIAAAAAAAWAECWDDPAGIGIDHTGRSVAAGRALQAALNATLQAQRQGLHQYQRRQQLEQPAHPQHQQSLSSASASAPLLLPHRYANNPHAFRSTNLHAHGLQVSPAEDDPFAHIAPGQSVLRRLAIPGDHPSGLHWLHPHSHASAAVQLSQGMAALLRVEGELDALMRSLGIREVVLPVTELTLQRLDALSQADIDAAVAKRQARDGNAAGSAAATSNAAAPSHAAAAPSHAPSPTATATPAVDFFPGGGQGSDGSGQWGGLFGWDPVPLACPGDGGVRWDVFEWHALVVCGRVTAVERRLEGGDNGTSSSGSRRTHDQSGFARPVSGSPGRQRVAGVDALASPGEHGAFASAAATSAAASLAPHGLRRAQTQPLDAATPSHTPYPTIDRDDPHDFRAGNLRFTGRQPVVEARYGELLWLRVVNGAPARPLVVTLDDLTNRWSLYLLAVDGITLPAPVRLQQGLTFAWGVDIEGGVLLPPGGRFDLLVQTPRAPRPQPSREPPPWALASKSGTPAPGSSPVPLPSPFPTLPPAPRPVREVVSLWSSRYVGCVDMADCPDYPAFLIASIRMPHPTDASGEELALPSPMPLPKALPTPASHHMAPISPSDVTKRRVFVLSQRMPHASAADLAAAQGPAKRDGDTAALDHVGFYINNATYDPNRVDVRVDFGAVEEWVIENPAPAHDHPWHVHGTPFMVVSLQDMATGREVLVQPYWADTVWVPLGMRAVTRLRFSRFRGVSVAHCHIASHESSGMMITYEVQ